LFARNFSTDESVRGSEIGSPSILFCFSANAFLQHRDGIRQIALLRVSASEVVVEHRIRGSPRSDRAAPLRRDRKLAGNSVGHCEMVDRDTPLRLAESS